MATVHAWMSGNVSTGLDRTYAGDQQLTYMAYVLNAAETTAAYGTAAKVDGDGRRTAALASAARTATVSSDAIYTRGAKGVIATLTATALAATPSITFSIQGYDATSASWVTILTSAAIVTAAPTSSTLTVYPGITVTANVTASTVLQDRIRITVTHSDSDSITYSVGLDWLD